MVEIERKFLLHEHGSSCLTDRAARAGWTVARLRADSAANGVPILQGYLDAVSGTSLAQQLGLPHQAAVEFRLRRKGHSCFFTLKGAGVLVRREVEVSLSERIFEEYWPHTQGRRVVKRRADLILDEVSFEVDCFADRDLILAEREANSESEAARIPEPGRDVTSDPAYKNRRLAR